MVRVLKILTFMAKRRYCFEKFCFHCHDQQLSAVRTHVYIHVHVHVHVHVCNCV